MYKQIYHFIGKIMQVPFGEWLPDQPEHLKPGANVATNVYHALNTYKRFPSLVAL